MFHHRITNIIVDKTFDGRKIERVSEILRVDPVELFCGRVSLGLSIEVD